MPEWDAEVVVDETLARALLDEQFPALPVRSLRKLAEGWDNTVWLANEAIVFRFPRRLIAIAGVEREIQMLPELAPLLPSPVPQPVFVGRRTDAFAWPFFGAPLLPGCELADAGLTDAGRAALAAPLGRFLRVLHAPELVERFGDRLPTDPNRRADMTRRVPMTRQRLDELRQRGLWDAPSPAWLEEAETLAPSSATAVTHGDLHVRHLLVDDSGALSGVIDWGDIGRSDPAIDLPAYWSVLPRSARRKFVAAYGPISSAALLRARVLALFLSATLALYADTEELPALALEALAGVERTLS
ncbi:MAG TPA: phosphotransferase [Candidatus Limnocylindria bacterium]|nr:phosphotransferase [Candidatus Limnocylindria bacterium]